jgi:hypothetical protein
LFFDAVEVREREFHVDDFDVVGRVYDIGDVDDVVVLEAAYDVCNRVGFANVGEEFIAEAFAFGIEVGTTRSGFTIAASSCRRGSGIGTTPELGSIVQNGKFSAAMPALVSALNSVDLPTLGRPTMPQLKPMMFTLL